MEKSFEEFFKHYLIASLWSTTDEALICQSCGKRYVTWYEGDCCDNKFEQQIVNLDDEHNIEDIEPESLEELKVEAKKFYDEYNNLFSYKEHWIHNEEYTDDMLAGHDFWLTRNGHGAGFWDHDMVNQEHADILTKACETYGELSLYINDANKIAKC